MLETNFSGKKPVIMQVLPALENGGVERGTIDIAKVLKKSGYEPIVMSSGGILVYQLNEAKIKHIKLDVASKNPFTIMSNAKAIAQIIAENNVDIVHVRSRAPMWSVHLAAKKTRIKIITTVHGTYSVKFLFSKNFFLKRMYNEVMLRADKIIVVSNFIKNYLVENYGQKSKFLDLSKIKIVHRGVDLENFNLEKVSKNRVIDLITKWNLPEDKKIILMPARYTAWKGHEFLLNALVKVQSDYLCVFVGSDHGHQTFRKKLEQKIVDLGLAGKVRMVGVCKDMATAYAISRVVICPSVRPEAFGRIAIESQAMQRPIISTRIGGSLETVIDGVTGYLVDVNDTEKLAELIDKVLNLSEEEIQEMGRKGRENVVQNFSNDTMALETLKVYNEVLETLRSVKNLD